jgi:hypothetical protein
MSAGDALFATDGLAEEPAGAPREMTVAINVTTDAGELIERVEVDETYDLDNYGHRSYVADQFLDAVERARAAGGDG